MDVRTVRPVRNGAVGRGRTALDRHGNGSLSRRQFVGAAGALAAFGSSLDRLGTTGTGDGGGGAGEMPVVTASLRYDVDAGVDVEHDCGRSHVRSDPSSGVFWLSRPAYETARRALAGADGLAVVQSRSLLAAVDGLFGADVFGATPTDRLPLDGGRAVRVLDGVRPPSVDLERVGELRVRATVAGASTVLGPAEREHVLLPSSSVTVRRPTGRTRTAPGKRPGETVTVPAFEAVERPATPTVTVEHLGVRAVRPFGA
ncbi:hypothetical protein ACFPYI_06390 [Halomarina salina]|uniref:Tat (Twin-arginine translocation) pathway signal sequence n=1 Tax=Halomarina salina TaxID=1872699 RepID=A0ABD5RKR0_9EURY|nr:hypothetical protein [Halomarina salina]